MDVTAGMTPAQLEEFKRKMEDELYLRRMQDQQRSPRKRAFNKKVRKGKPYGRVLFYVRKFDRETYYHATKGWRSRRG